MYGALSAFTVGDASCSPSAEALLFFDFSASSEDEADKSTSLTRLGGIFFTYARVTVTDGYGI